MSERFVTQELTKIAQSVQTVSQYSFGLLLSFSLLSAPSFAILNCPGYPHLLLKLPQGLLPELPVADGQQEVGDGRELIEVKVIAAGELGNLPIE